jgi:phage tail-like protein
MANGEKVDPYRGFSFIVEIGGIRQAGFAECTGFGSNNDAIEYREGDEPATVRKLPGLTKYANITLKWGLTDSRELYDWYRDVTQGKFERKNGSIVLLDLQGTEKVRWNFFRAWPTKWDGPDFNAEGTEVALELLELVNERIERA